MLQDREKLQSLWDRVKEEKAQQEIAVKEAEGRFILKLGELLKEYVKENGTVPFKVHAKLETNEDHWGGTYHSLEHDFHCPFQLAYILVHITNTDHLTRRFVEQDFGVPKWEMGKTYQNICEVALVGEDLVFRVLDRKVV